MTTNNDMKNEEKRKIERQKPTNLHLERIHSYTHKVATILIEFQKTIFDQRRHKIEDK